MKQISEYVSRIDDFFLYMIFTLNLYTDSAIYKNLYLAESIVLIDTLSIIRRNLAQIGCFLQLLFPNNYSAQVLNNLTSHVQNLPMRFAQ